MKKVLKMQNLDCANCAQKMEDAVRKIQGVEDVSISFLLQKMTLVAEEAAMADVLEQAQKACEKIDPDCKVIF